jgi:hypothetical protein
MPYFKRFRDMLPLLSVLVGFGLIAQSTSSTQDVQAEDLKVLEHKAEFKFTQVKESTL